MILLEIVVAMRRIRVGMNQDAMKVVEDVRIENRCELKHESSNEEEEFRIFVAL